MQRWYRILCPLSVRTGGFIFAQEGIILGIGQDALMLHMDGYNCAQAVLASAGKLTGLDEAEALAIAAGFGGGLRCGEVCGAVSGAVMTLGKCFPYNDSSDIEAKARIAELARNFCAEFKARFGDLRCDDIVGDRSHCNEYICAAAELLDYCLREELGETAPRRVCVTEPIKVVVDNYPEDKTEYFPLPNHPAHPELGTREVAFTRELYSEASDFAEVPPPKFHRLRPDGEVRLMGAYIVRLTDIVKNDDGSIRELHVTADLETGSGMPTDGRKVKGTVHWVSAAHCEDIDIVLYDRLFTIPDVASYTTSDHNVEEILEFVNPDSARRLTHAKAEPSITELRPGEAVQFVRMGYYTPDSKEIGVFNRIIPLKDGYRPG